MSKSCGEAIVALLEKLGIEQVFGIPGVHNLELYRGLASSSINHTLARHEQGAGFMADGYSRASGKVGVAFVITGPGVTNISTAIGQAYSDSVPVLVISSVNESWSLGKGAGRLHECKDQLKLTESITALSARAYCVEDVPKLLERAFDIFNSRRPRPVHIEIPLDILSEQVSDDWSIYPTAMMPIIDSVDQSVITSLQNAKHPMMIIGGGAVEARASVVKLAERLNMPVFCSVAGKGIMPPDHALNAGSTLCVAAGWEMISEADVILAVGTEMADTDFWRDTLPLAEAHTMIRIDIDPAKLADIYPSTIGVVADLNQYLPLLVEQFAVNEGDDSDVRLRVQSLQAQVRNELVDLDRKHAAIIRSIARAYYPGGVIASDMTQIAYAANFLITPSAPRKWLHPTGFGTLGYALPAGIGAAIATSTPVAVLVGDGGFQYTLMEMATAKEAIKTSLTVLLWNNSRLGQIWDDMEARDIEPMAVAMNNPDFQMLAQSYGFNAYQPTSLGELEGLLENLTGTVGVHFVEMKPNVLFAEL